MANADKEGTSRLDKPQSPRHDTGTMDIGNVTGSEPVSYIPELMMAIVVSAQLLWLG